MMSNVEPRTSATTGPSLPFFILNYSYHQHKPIHKPKILAIKQLSYHLSSLTSNSPKSPPHLGPQRPHGADVGHRLSGGLRGRGVGQLRARVHLGRRRGQDGAEAEASAVVAGRGAPRWDR